MTPLTASIVAIHRYPLKSATGERLTSVDVGRDGLAGDRGWAAVDDEGSHGSLKHPRRWVGLFDLTATVDGDDVRVRDAAGGSALAGSPEADALASRAVGRPVRLVRAGADDAPAQRQVHRLAPPIPDAAPSWDPAPPPESVTALLVQEAARPFHDAGAVHVVTTGDLQRLAVATGRDDLDATRMRANLVLDLDAAPEPRSTLVVGEVELIVGFPTPRCVVPGLEPGGDIDRGILTALAQGWRREVADIGTAVCFGVYCDVITPGTLSV